MNHNITRRNRGDPSLDRNTTFLASPLKRRRDFFIFKPRHRSNIDKALILDAKAYTFNLRQCGEAIEDIRRMTVEYNLPLTRRNPMRIRTITLPFAPSSSRNPATQTIQVAQYSASFVPNQILDMPPEQRLQGLQQYRSLLKARYDPGQQNLEIHTMARRLRALDRGFPFCNESIALQDVFGPVSYEGKRKGKMIEKRERCISDDDIIAIDWVKSGAEPMLMHSGGLKKQV